MDIYRIEDGEKQTINALRFNPELHSMEPVKKEVKKEQGEEEVALRAKAKEAGIKSSHNKSLDKLEAELKELNQE